MMYTVEYWQGGRQLPSLDAAAPDAPVFRAFRGRRGLHQVERRTVAGNWYRVDTLPGVTSAGTKRRR